MVKSDLARRGLILLGTLACGVELTILLVRDDAGRRADDAQAERRCAVFQGHRYWVHGVAFSPDGQTLASVAGEGTRAPGEVKLWDIRTRRERAPLAGHEAAAMDVAFSPDGKFMATAGLDHTVRLWDTATMKETAVLPAAAGSGASAVAFSPAAESLFATTCHVGPVLLWDVATASLRGQCPGCFRIALAPDGRTLASVGERLDHVCLCDLQEKREREFLIGHPPTVTAVAFSPDGRLLASTGTDGCVRLWDPSTGSNQGVLRGHDQTVNCLAFSPNGRTLATGGLDRTVRLWDVTTGTASVLRGHTGAVHAVAFAPDGMRVASGSFDKTVRLWELFGEMPSAESSPPVATAARLQPALDSPRTD